MEPLHSQLAENWRHAVFALSIFLHFSSTQNLQINKKTYSTVHSQHDEGYEEEERPDLGSWQGCYGLWIHLKYQSRSCMEKNDNSKFPSLKKITMLFFQKNF